MLKNELKLTYFEILEKMGVPRLRQNDDNVWQGCCDDSFCFASCFLPDCRSEFRRAATPNAHREIVLAEARCQNPSIAVIEGMLKKLEKYNG